MIAEGKWKITIADSDFSTIQGDATIVLRIKWEKRGATAWELQEALQKELTALTARYSPDYSIDAAETLAEAEPRERDD